MAAADGRLYVATQDDRILCLGGRAGQPMIVTMDGPTGAGERLVFRPTFYVS